MSRGPFAFHAFAQDLWLLRFHSLLHSNYSRVRRIYNGITHDGLLWLLYYLLNVPRTENFSIFIFHLLETKIKSIFHYILINHRRYRRINYNIRQRSQISASLLKRTPYGLRLQLAFFVAIEIFSSSSTRYTKYMCDVLITSYLSNRY